MNNKKPAKIAVVIPKYGLVGGGEKFASELTERIAQSESYEIHVFANQWLAESSRIRFHKIPIISFPKFLTTVSFAFFAQKKLKRIDFDLVHSHERIFTADIVSLHCIPHRLWIQDVRKKRMLSLFDRATIMVERQMVLNKNTIFMPVSDITKEKFIAEYPFLSKRVETLHPGVDLKAFDGLDRNQCRKRIQAQFGFQDDDTVLLFVGMNFELKGLDQLIRAVAKIKKTGHEKQMKILVAGKGNTRKYEKMAKNAGLEAGDICFTGVIKENMEEIFMSVDIFAMLSQFDTFGMTVLEAMSASLPVIISHNVGAKDMVKDGVNGYIVERDNIDAISEKIRLLLDKKKKIIMGLNAHEVAKNHSWDVMAGKVTEIYQKILSSAYR